VCALQCEWVHVLVEAFLVLFSILSLRSCIFFATCCTVFLFYSRTHVHTHMHTHNDRETDKRKDKQSHRQTQPREQERGCVNRGAERSGGGEGQRERMGWDGGGPSFAREQKLVQINPALFLSRSLILSLSGSLPLSRFRFRTRALYLPLARATSFPCLRFLSFSFSHSLSPPRPLFFFLNLNPLSPRSFLETGFRPLCPSSD